jgi:formamidopyrimidine-DNA glycosylase
MPELPEVEAVTRKLRAAALGAVIVDAGVYRPSILHPQKLATLKRTLRGRIIEDISRRGKHILVHLSQDHVLRVHLRMTGNLTVIPDARLKPWSARAWFPLDDGRAVILDDPRALGRVSLHRTAALGALFDKIGPEPLSPGFTLDDFRARAARTRKPAKIFLMDQQAVSGLGNIYAAEALFQSGIHPARPVSGLSQPRLLRLYDAIRNVLTLALDSAIAAYDSPGGFQEGENFPVAVYGREGEACPRCGARVRRIPQGGRSTYFCPRCQR